MSPPFKCCLNIYYSVAANVANTRNILLKPIESPSNDLETLTEEGENNEQTNQIDCISTHNRDGVPGESSIPLQLRGLSSNGLDGELVLHKEENNYSSNSSRQGQGLPKDNNVEEGRYVENACLVNVDPLTKSSTIVTQLSSVHEEESDAMVNQDIINDDGKHFYTKSCFECSNERRCFELTDILFIFF